MKKKLLLIIFLISFVFWSENVFAQTKGVEQQIMKELPTKRANAVWVSSDVIAIEMSESLKSYRYFLQYEENGDIKLEDNKLKGGESFELKFDGIIDEHDSLYKKYPYLKGYLKLSTSEIKNLIPEILKDYVIISAIDGNGKIIYLSSIQSYGILDELYTYKGDDLGISFDKNLVPTLKLWSPVAKSVRIQIFDNSDTLVPVESKEMKLLDKGVWSVTGKKEWKNLFYLYEIDVFNLNTGKVERNLVTDPYSLSLSINSKKSQIIDLNDTHLKPKDWNSLKKPKLDSIRDIVLYELHLRDFSINDKTVSEKNRGTFLAFTEKNSNGMKHLKKMANAGLTHVHLLPVFDIATIEENKSLQQNPVIPENLAPNSTEQQEIISKHKDKDGFNWGYDPFHYVVPEGSYSTDPNSSNRILEFRKMVKSLNETGLRVIMDVVYNHTASCGQSDTSVFDKIVPNYYYRLDKEGRIQSTTCCSDTASEHAMMEKLMIDTLKLWATQYKVDGFRFDLMGHHTTSNIQKIKDTLNALTLEKDGVDGKKIYLYGEGWKFGSLDAILKDEAFNQVNAFGYGVGTFNDRMRDSLRGGNFSHDTKSDQGFINGLYYDYNNEPANRETPKDLEQQKKQLLNYTDNIRIGLVGGLRDYKFINSDGKLIKGSEINYRGSNSAYTADPIECINYVSAHDNYSLWDQISAKAPFNTERRVPTTATSQEKADMQKMGLSLVMFAQGIPFFDAGVEILRSKSGDGDSYNSGDWFNKLDYSYETNNWGIGLPIEEKNKNEWSFWSPRLADKNFKPSKATIVSTFDYFLDLLKVRRSSKLFHLDTKQVMDRVRFIDSEETQIPGLIVMTISDKIEGKDNLDPDRKLIVVLFNARREKIEFSHNSLKNINLKLYSEFEKVKGANFDENSGTITIPARTTLVYYETEK